MIDAQAIQLTPTGRGAVASVAVIGPDSLFVIKQFFTPGRSGLRYQPGQVRYGAWSVKEDGESEGIVLAVRDLNHFELHCHGGRAAVSRIVRCLSDAGCRQLDMDTYLAIKGERQLERECLDVVIRTQTLRTAAIAWSQARGALRNELSRIDKCIEIHQRAEALFAVNRLLDTSTIGLHLVTPWRVALVGPPNVGKSSLLNAFAGWQLAITAITPGTTRDVIGLDLAIEGWPFRMEDTAGVRDTDETIEAEGVARALERAKHADVVLLIVDAHIGPTETHNFLAASAVKCLWVWNKVDLVLPDSSHNWYATSATTSAGVAELMNAVLRTLIPAPPEVGQPLLLTQRHIDTVQSLRDNMLSSDFDNARLTLKKTLDE